MDGAVLEQLAVITYKEDGECTWSYGVVEKIFDNQIHILRKNGSRFIDFCENAKSETISVFYLTSDGEPVLSGKNIFGKYNFKPKKLDK